MRIGWIRLNSVGKPKMFTEKSIWQRISSSIIYSIFLIFSITTKILSNSRMTWIEQKKTDLPSKCDIYHIYHVNAWNTVYLKSYLASCFRRIKRKQNSSLNTGWKVSKYGVFSGPYFPHSDWIRRDIRILRISPYSVRMRENTDQKKLRIWTLFTQCQQLKNSRTLKYLKLINDGMSIAKREIFGLFTGDTVCVSMSNHRI